MTYQEGVVVLLVFRLFCPHCLGDGRNVKAKSRHTFRLPYHDEDLGVKVHIQLIGVGVFDQQGSCEARLGCLNLRINKSTLKSVYSKQGYNKFSVITNVFLIFPDHFAYS